MIRGLGICAGPCKGSDSAFPLERAMREAVEATPTEGSRHTFSFAGRRDRLLQSLRCP
jgi:hypothetical protein